MNKSHDTGPATAGMVGATDAPRRGYAMVLMVVSSVAISFGGLIMRNMEEAGPWQIIFYRAIALVAAIVLILVIQYRGAVMPQVTRIGRAGVIAGIILALAGITFIQAITHTTVANTMFALSGIPFITAGLAWIFLGEPLRRATLVTMVVAALGVIIMVADGFGIGAGYGNLMALATACGFASFAVIMRSYRHVDMLPTLLVSGVFLIAVSGVIAIEDLSITMHDLALCILWGGILSGFGNAMFIVASRHLVAAELTLFMLLEFALSPLWVWVFVNETPTRLALIGGLLVIGSVGARTVLQLRESAARLKRGRPSPM